MVPGTPGSSQTFADEAPARVATRPESVPRRRRSTTSPPPSARPRSASPIRVSVAGPRQVHTVKSGDTPTSIARKFDMSVSELADANDLSAKKTLRPGARIRGPATTNKAYVVQSGDTLGDIAKRFNVSVRSLAGENNLRSTASLKKGQKIVLPDGYKDKGPLKTTTTVARQPEPSNTYARAETPAPRPSTPSAPVPYTPSGNSYPRPSAPVAVQPVVPPSSTTRPIIESSAAPAEAEIIASGKGKFAWPVRGEIISASAPTARPRQ
ncbi:LysM peptidoglycan-binding domain-containing protein [Caulobacter segnis]